MAEIEIKREEIKTQNQTIPKLKKCFLSVNPLWGDDAGRDTMDVHYSGTFKGWFTQLRLDIGRTTIEELNLIKKLLERPILELEYPLDRDLEDKKAGTRYSEQFYGTAIETGFSNYKGKYDAFEITLTAVERRPLDV